MKVGSLFSGIGGLELGLERAGMEVVWQVEIDPYCRRVLAKHWPDVARYEDVKDVGRHNLASVDLICGGFPCQPISVAGRQLAQDDARWLWPEFARILRELRPRYVIVENVPGLLTRGMGDVLRDLATLGYDAEWESIPASAVGAPHLRYRVFIVAHADIKRSDAGIQVGRSKQPICDSQWDGAGAKTGRQKLQPRTSGLCQDVADALHSGLEGYTGDEVQRDEPGRLNTGPNGHIGAEVLLARGDWWATEPGVGRVADGVPGRVDRLKALGNAVVSQVAEWIGHQIMRVENG